MVEVGEGALAEFFDREMFLSLPGLAEILDGPQRPQGGVEEGEEVGDEDVVEEEATIPVWRLLAELVDEAFEGANLLGPEDAIGPDGQVAPDPLLRPGKFGSRGRRDRARGSRFGRHSGRL